MPRADLQPHQHHSQGWTMIITAPDGSLSACGAVGFLDQAVNMAADQGARLRISAQVRRQMEDEGCAPAAWPDAVDWPGPVWISASLLQRDGRARRDSSGRQLKISRR